MPLLLTPEETASRLLQQQTALLRANLASQLAGPLLVFEYQGELFEVQKENELYGNDDDSNRRLVVKVPVARVAKLALDTADQILRQVELFSAER